MILVDTSVWIDHLHKVEPRLVEQLERDEVACHPLVIEELALGSLADRAAILRLLGDLAAMPMVSHVEVRTLVESHELWGRGLSAVDAHLLRPSGSCRVPSSGRGTSVSRPLRIHIGVRTPRSYHAEVASVIAPHDGRLGRAALPTYWARSRRAR